MNKMKSEQEQHLYAVYASEEILMKTFAVITPNSSIESTSPTENQRALSGNATVNNKVMIKVLQPLKDFKNDTSRKREKTIMTVI